MVSCLQLEKDERAAYRKEMLALIQKRNARKGNLASVRSVPASHPTAQGTAGGANREVERAGTNAIKSAPAERPDAQAQAVPDRATADRSAERPKLLPVDVDGHTRQLDISVCGSIQDVIDAVKTLFSSTRWPEVRSWSAHDVQASDAAFG